MSLLVIGKFIKPFGLKGELKVDFYIDHIDELSKMGVFYVEDKKSETGYKPLEIEWIKEQGARFIAALPQVTGREQADLWREKEIFVDEESIPDTEEDEFFIKDIIHNEVFYREEKFGIVNNVLNIANQSMIIIMMNNKKELVVPFQDRYVGDVNTNENRIELRNLEELL